MNITLKQIKDYSERAKAYYAIIGQEETEETKLVFNNYFKIDKELMKDVKHSHKTYYLASAIKEFIYNATIIGMSCEDIHEIIELMIKKANL